MQNSVIEQVTQLMGGIWRKMLAGGWWTFATCAWVGLLLAAFLTMTVYNRPVEEVLSNSFRVEHILKLWYDYGFFQLAGLGCSESPTVNPQALVYRSRPPVFLYPLYVMNLANEAITGEPFSLRLYVVYTQAVLYVAGTLLGFLGVRLARRMGAAPLLALVCGLVGQGIFQTFPDNLNWYFEPLAEQFSCVVMFAFLLIEEWDFSAQTRRAKILGVLCIFLFIYLDKGLTIPALTAYCFAALLFGAWHLRKIISFAIAAIFGIGLHLFQLFWMSSAFPQVTFVGSTFLYRSGLDGATNHVGLLTPANLGSANLFLRNSALIVLIALLVWCLKYRVSPLKQALLLLALPLSFYLISGYFLSQWAMIHPYMHDIFLSVAAVMLLCFMAAPYLEHLTGNTGVVTWALFIVGFCLCMYQLRQFAIAHPLPIPEPDWRAYRYFG